MQHAPTITTGSQEHSHTTPLHGAPGGSTAPGDPGVSGQPGNASGSGGGKALQGASAASEAPAWAGQHGAPAGGIPPPLTEPVKAIGSNDEVQDQTQAPPQPVQGPQTLQHPEQAGPESHLQQQSAQDTQSYPASEQAGPESHQSRTVHDTRTLPAPEQAGPESHPQQQTTQKVRKHPFMAKGRTSAATHKRRSGLKEERQTLSAKIPEVAGGPSNNLPRSNDADERLAPCHGDSSDPHNEPSDPSYAPSAAPLRRSLRHASRRVPKQAGSKTPKAMPTRKRAQGQSSPKSKKTAASDEATHPKVHHPTTKSRLKGRGLRGKVGTEHDPRSPEVNKNVNTQPSLREDIEVHNAASLEAPQMGIITITTGQPAERPGSEVRIGAAPFYLGDLFSYAHSHRQVRLHMLMRDAKAL